MSASIVGMCAAFYAMIAACVFMLGGTLLQSACTAALVCVQLIVILAFVTGFGLAASAIATYFGMPA